MKEIDLYKKVKKVLSPVGLVVRLENAASSSVPDIAFFSASGTIWIEAKLRIGNQIVLNRFQWSLALSIDNIPDFPSYQYLFAVDAPDFPSPYVYHFRYLKDLPRSIRKSGHVAIDVSKAVPQHTLKHLYRDISAMHNRHSSVHQIVLSTN